MLSLSTKVIFFQDVNVTKKLMQGALDAVKQAKWSLGETTKRIKDGKPNVEEFKV